MSKQRTVADTLKANFHRSRERVRSTEDEEIPPIPTPIQRVPNKQSFNARDSDIVSRMRDVRLKDEDDESFDQDTSLYDDENYDDKVYKSPVAVNRKKDTEEHWNRRSPPSRGGSVGSKQRQQNLDDEEDSPPHVRQSFSYENDEEEKDEIQPQVRGGVRPQNKSPSRVPVEPRRSLNKSPPRVHAEPIRRSPVNDNEFTLSKNTVSNLAKSVGVNSVASDVLNILKTAVKNYVENILTNASQQTNGPITSSIIEPLTSRQMGTVAEDLEESYLNVNPTVKFIKTLAADLNVNIAREACLYLTNAIEWYLLLLLTNANDIAKNNRRSRVSAGDVNIAIRLTNR